MKEKIEICDGDLLLFTHRGKTVLQLQSPAHSGEKEVSVKGRFRNWCAREWEALRIKAARFQQQCPEVVRELAKIERSVKIEKELHVVDDDAERQDIEGLHTLELSYSKTRGYIRIRGNGTFKISGELKALGMFWDPVRRAWSCGFSDATLCAGSELLRVHDEKRDPIAAGYVRCLECRQWNPRGVTCACAGFASGPDMVAVRFLKPFSRTQGVGAIGRLPATQAVALEKVGVVELVKTSTRGGRSS